MGCRYLDLVGDEFAGQDTLCKAVARVPRHDLRIAFALFEPDKTHQVCRV